MARARTPRPTQREAIIASTMGARPGLGAMLAQQGAGKDITDAVEQIEAVPGGVELLYTLAAEDLMKAQGIPKKDIKKIRLYAHGGPVYAEGGDVRAAAAKTKRAGGEDSMMLHLSPEEYEVITSMWGEPEINEETGIGEYGFLRKIFKKVKKAVKKVVKSKIFRVVAPIALSVFAPGLGTAIGSSLLGSGASAAAIGAVGNAVVQGGLGAITGGKEGLIRGALMGGVTGGLGKMAGTQVKKLAPGLSERTANIVGSSLASGVGSELTGGDFATGAIMGGLGEYARPGLEQLSERARGMMGLEARPGQIFAGRRLGVDMPTAGRYDPATGEYIPSQYEVTGPPAPTDGGIFAGGPLENLPSWALPAAGLGLAAMAGRTGEVEEGAPPPLPEGFEESLPVYTMNRVFQGLPDPRDYYTYGQPGAPQSGQHLFITPPGPFGGLGPVGTQPEEDPIPGAGRIPMREGGLGAKFGYREGGGLGDYWEQNEDVARISPTVSASGRYVKGPGSGRSDDIEALLSDGEYVIDAESVALLGDGSGEAGARRLDEMRANLRKHKGQKLKKGEFTHKAKRPEQYMGRLRAAAGRA